MGRLYGLPSCGLVVVGSGSVSPYGWISNTYLLYLVVYIDDIRVNVRLKMLISFSLILYRAKDGHSPL